MNDPVPRKTPAVVGGGAFGNDINSDSENTSPGSATQQICDTFAAEVLKIGGKIHRLPDGKARFFQFSILNPSALRPTNRRGRN